MWASPSNRCPAAATAAGKDCGPLRGSGERSGAPVGTPAGVFLFVGGRFPEYAPIIKVAPRVAPDASRRTALTRLPSWMFIALSSFARYFCFKGTINLKKFDKKVASWLSEDEPNLLGRLWKILLFIRYNTFLSGYSLGSLLSWLSRAAMSTSGPAITYFVFSKIALLEAAIASSAIFLLFTVNSVIEQWLKRKSSVVDAASAETWVRIGDLITSVKSSATPADERDSSITATLGVIEGYARTVTRSPKGGISVSLALYDGGSTQKMRIKHRNPGNERPIGRPVKNLSRVLGHIACQSGPGARVVNDLKEFGHEAMFSPTQSSRNYRSLLLIPITSSRTQKVKGFISIDSSTPYAFYRNRGAQLMVTCEPLIDHIQEQC